ncbi:DUF6503 family protein [Gilvibacter sp.]|uniref:DUF6503 family protein n=1 Tax=Gilvibacter sp. TaxID=2729997 RepID=UPI003F4A693E
MKPLLLGLAALALVACNNTTQSNDKDQTETPAEQEVAEAAPRMFPKSIGPVFEAHGGIAQWDKMNNLCFEIPKPSGLEKHSTDLKSRRARIEHKDWVIGYDGTDVWLDQDSTAYKGNARFYHNLYFYFYAMPFIVADPGVNYQQLAEPLEFEGKKYPGTLISYNDGVGDSPKDEYIIYRDPETGQMAWLAYTVTYRDNEKKDNFSFIKYSEWQEVNGLVLPKTLTWYTVEDGQPTAPRSDVSFEKVNITETQLDGSLFTKPEGAEVVPR